MHSSGNASSLPLRARRTVQVDGTETIEASVFCARRGRSLPADECASCEHWAGLSVTSDVAASRMLCADATERPLGDPRDPILATLMTRDVLCVRPEVPLGRLVQLMVTEGISGLPVVDAAGRPVGVVSQTDVLRNLGERAEVEVVTAETLLTPVAFTLPEDAPVSRAAALMAYEGIHRIPVVDADGAVVGILSALDIARWVAEEAGWLRR